MGAQRLLRQTLFHVNRHADTTQTILALALRAALLLALFGAGWSIYRRLPEDTSGIFDSGAQATETRLRIVLRRAPDEETRALEEDVPVQLYSINLAATQREYLTERRAGVSLQDFMTRRMQGRPVVEARLDESGQATVTVASGTWWVHATRAGQMEEVTRRLRVNVAGRQQTVELTSDNAYTRAKKF